MQDRRRLRSLWRFVPGLVALALALQLHPSAAEEGVLIENIPPGLDKATVLTVVRNALNYREWTIVDTFPSAVSARISRGRMDARIRISVVDNTLRYQESAVQTELSQKISKTTTPSRWINFLRSDISEELQARAKVVADSGKPAPKETPKGRGNAVQRMQELKQLHESGLITAEEYERKRAEILKEL
jgi:Short C-terminal domain